MMVNNRMFTNSFDKGGKMLGILRKRLGEYSSGTFPTTTPSYDSGGDLGELTTVKNKNGTITNIYKTKFGLITQVKTKDGKYYEKTSPNLTLEEKVDKILGNPQKKAVEFTSKVTPKGEDALDNVRHMSAGRYTAEALLKNARNGAIPFPDFINKANSWVVANVLGVAHEATTLFDKDSGGDRPWGIKLKEAGEDIYNNAVGVNLGLSDKTYTNKRNAIIDNSFYHKVPDGYGEYHPYHNKFVDPYELKKNKKGGMLLYKKGGSIHIAENKKGTFTAAATKHGKSVQGFANQVLSHKENYSPTMVKKANFARNASKWKK